MAQNRISTLLQQNEEPRLKETVNAVLYLAGPAILEQLMFTALQYVDTAMVGRLGAAATAAVGTTSSTIWLFNGLFAAASIGFSVQVAQFLGARRNEDARSVTAQSLHFTVSLRGPERRQLTFSVRVSTAAVEKSSSPAETEPE